MVLAYSSVAFKDYQNLSYYFWTVRNAVFLVYIYSIQKKMINRGTLSTNILSVVFLIWFGVRKTDFVLFLIHLLFLAVVDLPFSPKLQSIWINGRLLIHSNKSLVNVRILTLCFITFWKHTHYWKSFASKLQNKLAYWGRF